MQVQLKSIRDYVGDVRSQPRDNAGNPIPNPAHQPNLTIHSTVTRERMWGKGANQPLEVSVYSIAPGEEDTWHHHPDHIELVICWRGRGTATIVRTSAGPAFEFPIQPGDSIVVPKGALHKFKALLNDEMLLPNPANLPVPIQPSRIWPVEKLELVVIHAHGCVRVPDAGRLPAVQKLDRNDPDPKIANELYRMMRPIGKFCGYARDPKLQCVRSRIWGREAERNFAGDADDAKPTLHFTAYTFIPGQENPEHYHPLSVEFVMCLQGRAHMTVRPMLKPGDFEAGWKDPCNVAEMNEGDTALVPMGALHWYCNATNEDCVLIALQSPHPILHILEDDAPVAPVTRRL